MLLWLALYAFASQAADRISQRSYFEDASGTLQLEQVRSAPWQSYTGVLSRGYGASALWLRLRVEPGPAAEKQPLVLRIRPSYLDDIRLYDPDAQQGDALALGDSHPQHKGAFSSLNFSFSLPRADQVRDIWLRVSTTSTRIIHVQALEVDEAIQADRQQELFYSLYLAALTLFLVWAAAQWLQSREPLMGAFVVRQAMALGYSLGYMGYFRVFWIENPIFATPDTLTSVLIIAFVASAYRFDYLMLREHRAHRWALRAIGLLWALCPAYYLLMLAGETRLALAINMGFVLFSPFLALVTTLTVPSSQPPAQEASPVISKSALITIYGLILAGLSISAFPAMGLINGVELSLQGFLFYGLVSGITLLFMLQVRAQRMSQQRVVLERQIHIAEQAARLETERRMELGGFLAMLAHELKTPLAVIKMVLGARSATPAMIAEAERSVRDMNAVIERCLQADQLDDQRLEPRSAPCHLEQELQIITKQCTDPSRIHLQGAGVQPIDTDPALLRIILNNLVDNALKYAAPGTTIEVHVCDATLNGLEGISLRVANEPGPAGSPDPGQVFQKYYRHPKAKRLTGSGLGLYLVAKLCQLLRGEVNCVSDPHKVTFHLWLPRSASF
ncbi:MAG: hypothetical protein RJA34_1244 [Pseudomonadota bacterium]|jgi:signal transduction histidine kinase